MTNNTMREALIKFGDENPSLDLDFRLHTHGKYLTQEKAIVASRAFKAGAAWQAARTVPEGWIPVSERLPEPGKVVLAFYKNSVGGDRIICAFHAPKHTLEADCHDDGSCFDFDEATNTDYMAEGWLERLDNWGEYRSIYVIEGDVTHWMPLPAAPSPALPLLSGRG